MLAEDRFEFREIPRETARASDKKGQGRTVVYDGGDLSFLERLIDQLPYNSSKRGQLPYKSSERGSTHTCRVYKKGTVVDDGGDLSILERLVRLASKLYTVLVTSLYGIANKLLLATRLIPIQILLTRFYVQL